MDRKCIHIRTLIPECNIIHQNPQKNPLSSQQIVVAVIIAVAYYRLDQNGCWRKAETEHVSNGNNNFEMEDVENINWHPESIQINQINAYKPRRMLSIRKKTKRTECRIIMLKTHQYRASIASNASVAAAHVLQQTVFAFPSNQNQHLIEKILTVYTYKCILFLLSFVFIGIQIAKFMHFHSAWHDEENGGLFHCSCNMFFFFFCMELRA